MNIFYLDADPILAAQYQCDKHVVKMVLETAQLLSTAHHLAGSDTADKMYKMTHQHHPCTKWVMQGRDNYAWLLHHFAALANEYHYRYGKVHKSWDKLAKLCANTPPSIPRGSTMPAQAMPDAYKDSDPVKAYRQYYLNDKAYILRYTKRGKPAWMGI